MAARDKTCNFEGKYKTLKVSPAKNTNYKSALP
jgi:hypothetical protein